MYHRNIIRKWIADGEGPNLDFKQTITSAAKISRSIVAFANSRGGKIVVGIGDHGHIIGVDADEEMYELEKSAAKFCVPAIELEFEQYVHYGKMILIAHVVESNKKPHFAIDKKGRQKIYVRIADECVVPNKTIEKLLLDGDMNYLQRNHQYTNLKRNLLEYFTKQKTINTAQYMQLRKTTERNANRALTDLLFEGFLQKKTADSFSLNPTHYRNR